MIQLRSYQTVVTYVMYAIDGVCTYKVAQSDEVNCLCNIPQYLKNYIRLESSIRASTGSPFYCKRGCTMHLDTRREVKYTAPNRLNCALTQDLLCHLHTQTDANVHPIERRQGEPAGYGVSLLINISKRSADIPVFPQRNTSVVLEQLVNRRPLHVSEYNV